LFNAVASLEVRAGAPSHPLKELALTDLGIPKQAWTDALRPKVKALKDLAIQHRDAARLAAQAENHAALAPAIGSELPTGLTHSWALNMLPPGPGPEITPKRQEVMRAFRHLAETRTNALRLNSMTGQIELLPPGAITPMQLPDDQVQDFYLPMATIGWEVSKELASDALAYHARCNSYNPVEEYLAAVANDPSLAPFDLATAAKELLGVDDPLSAVLLRKTLIQAAARAMEPGARAESVCVLQGGQAALKSSFWRELMPNPRWHIDTIPKDSKDFQIQQHRCWVFELGEIDHLLRAYDAAELKRLITSRLDLVRRPYGKNPEDLLRPSVMVGTCNPTDFFRDEENRRFWVIQVPTTNSINIPAVIANRDAIWKAACLAVQQGGPHCWWLTPDEADGLRQRNLAFHAEGQFDGALAAWLRQQGYGACFSTTTALLACGGIQEMERAGVRERREASAALLRFGWVKDRHRPTSGANALNVWRRANEPCASYLPEPSRPAQQHWR
jgi:predicted P-loop ATPase